MNKKSDRSFEVNVARERSLYSNIQDLANYH
jgi:hypothetical protein